jgi:Secretion system C-terminal sorting domain
MSSELPILLLFTSKTFVMKKYVLIFLVLFSIGKFSNAQCALGTQRFIVKNTNTTNPSNTVLTVDIIFDLQNNLGNKYVLFHMWKVNEYPGYFEIVSPGSCAPGGHQSAVDPPKSGTNAQGNLDAAVANIGFNNDFGTAGYLNFLTTYPPDLTVAMSTGSNPVIAAASSVVGYTTYTMRNVVINTGLPSGSLLEFRADMWAANNSSTSKAQCWSCNFHYLFNEPIISGLINCGSTTSTARTVTFNLSTLNTFSLGGLYNFYLDNAPFGTFGAEDYGTSVANGTFSNLTQSTPQFFNNIPYTGNNTKPQADLNIWIEAKVTSPADVQTNSTVKLIANQCSPLPISLRNFNANQHNGKVALTWETDQENNNDGFEVQRRLGNGKYETIAFVDSKAPGGNGGSNTYSFDDNLSAANKIAYYRLRQIDFDGRSNYSEIKSVRNGAKQIVVSVYPNPSRGTANVAIPEGVGIMDISLNDLTGKSVQRWNSVNMRSLQLSNLKPGIYMLRINFRESGDQVVERIVVQ